MRTQVVPGAHPDSSGIRWNWQSTGIRRQVLVTRRKVHMGRFEATLLEVILTVAAHYTDTGPSGQESLYIVCHRALFRASNRSHDANVPNLLCLLCRTVCDGMAQAEAEPVMSEMDYWACCLRWALAPRPAAGESLSSSHSKAQANLSPD